MADSSTALDGLAGDGAVIGVDLGGTKLAAALFGADGREVRGETIRVAGMDPDAVVDALAEAVSDLAAHADGPVTGAGYGIPGTIEQRTGTVVLTANLPLKDVPLRGILEERTGIPTFLDNDANVAALAEQRAGAGIVDGGTDNLLMVTLGTGFGGGAIVDGRIMRGTDGGGAEFGHVPLEADGEPCNSPGCTGFGCIENYVCGTALGRQLAAFCEERPDSALARRVADGEPMLGETVSRLALEGDADAIALLERQGRWLGMGLVGFVNVFSPDVVAVGGGMSPALPLMLPVAERIVRERALPPGNGRARLMPARFGAEAGVIGAAMLARLELELAGGRAPAGTASA